MTPEQIIKEQAPDDLALLNYIEQEGLTGTDATAIAKAWKAACRHKAAQLSKQLLMDQFNIRYLKSEHDHQVKQLDALGISDDQFFEQRINTVIALYKSLLSQQVEQSDEVSLEQAAIKYGDGWRTISSMQMDSPITLGRILTSIEIGYMTDGFIDGWKTHDLLTRHKATQLFKQQGKYERLD